MPRFLRCWCMFVLHATVFSSYCVLFGYILCSDSVTKMSEAGSTSLTTSSRQPSPTRQPAPPPVEVAVPPVQSQPAIVHILPNQSVSQLRPEMVVLPPSVAASQPQATVVQLQPNQTKSIALAQFSQGQHRGMPVIDNSVAEALLSSG